MQSYDTSYGTFYGDSRSIRNAGATMTQAPRVPTPGYAPAAQMAMAATMPAPAVAADSYANFVQQSPDRTQFRPRSGNWPQLVPVPSKNEFYPTGHRQSYIESRKTFKRTAQVIGMPPKPSPINFASPTSDKIAAANNYGKQSMSRRLQEQYQLRYHVPGYQGFVPSSQFKHGKSYGYHTRECIMQEYL
jgi:hypothetical protein